MRPKRRVHPGDILKIPVDFSLFALAQVVAQSEHSFEYIIAFDKFFSDEHLIDIAAITKMDIILLAQVSGGVNTNPKRLKWPVLGNTSVREDVIIPEYKVLISRSWTVVNWEGKILRSASDEEIANLKFEESFSPAAIEKSLKAYLGFEEPGSFYERLINRKPLKDVTRS